MFSGSERNSYQGIANSRTRGFQEDGPGNIEDHLMANGLPSQPRRRA